MTFSRCLKERNISTLAKSLKWKKLDLTTDLFQVAYFIPLIVVLVNYNNPDLLTKEVWSSSKKLYFLTSWMHANITILKIIFKIVLN